MKKNLFNSLALVPVFLVMVLSTSLLLISPKDIQAEDFNDRGFDTDSWSGGATRNDFMDNNTLGGGLCPCGDLWSCSQGAGDNNVCELSCVDCPPLPPAETWTEYCTGGNDPNGNNWQWWRKSNLDNYQYVRPGDGVCAPPVIPPPPRPSQPSISHTCNAAGTEVTINWTSSANADRYGFRLDDSSNPWSGTCSWLYPGDACFETTGQSYTRGVVPNIGYSAWVHGVGPGGWSDHSSVGFTCVPPSLPAPVNGQCGSANFTTVSAAPTGGAACASGTQSPMSSTPTNFSWSCQGANGGSNSSCSANRFVTPGPGTTTPAVVGQCGTANFTTVSAAPTGGAACAVGTLTGMTYSAPNHTWTCAGSLPMYNATCFATQTTIPTGAVDGVCGALQGVPVTSLPTGGNACLAGARINEWSDVSNFYWSCAGTLGGSNASCSAPIQSAPSTPTPDPVLIVRASSGIDHMHFSSTPLTVTIPATETVERISWMNAAGSVDTCSKTNFSTPGDTSIQNLIGVTPAIQPTPTAPVPYRLVCTNTALGLSATREIIVSKEAALPDVDLQYSLNGGTTWTDWTTTLSVESGPGVQVRVRSQSTSQAAHSCTITGAGLSVTQSLSAPGMLLVPGTAGTQLTKPAPGDSATVSLTCTNSVPDTSPVTITRTIETQRVPDFIPQISLQSGASAPDHLTGTWSVSFSALVNNVGDGITGQIRYALQWLEEGTSNWVSFQTGFLNDLAGGATSNTIPGTLSNITWGNHQYRMVVNEDADGVTRNTALGENNFANNITAPQSFLLNPPPPDLDIEILQDGRIVKVIRNGTTVEVRVEIGAGYPLTCELSGPSVAPALRTINHTGIPATESYQISTSALTNTSLYQISCTDPVGIVHTSSMGRVEVTPIIQEL